MDNLIRPNWPAPNNIKACTTTRLGGCSDAPYDSFNISLTVGDDPRAVTNNRQSLRQQLNLPKEPFWLNQVHGVNVVDAGHSPVTPDADASISNEPGVVCAAMTADCLPILVCNRQGTQVAAIHAGWRSLAGGIIKATLDKMAMPASDTLVWLGPAISGAKFEVGSDVKLMFEKGFSESGQCFTPISDEKWLGDLYAIAKLHLNALGIENIYGGNFCTYSEPERFFSFRRDHVTGRMVSLIWIDINTPGE